MDRTGDSVAARTPKHHRRPEVDKIAWMGISGDVEFLQRLWNLETMPSYDPRFRDAARDIWQHRWNNNDWDGVFEDKRFDLIGGPADRFLAFLAEMIQPACILRQIDAIVFVDENSQGPC